MRIGIDIDNTITDTQKIFLEYCYIYDKTLRNSGIINEDSANVQEKFDWSNEEQIYFNKRYVDDVIKNAIIYADAKRIINLLYQEGHEIYFITARSKKYCLKTHEITSDWLKSNDIKFSKLISEAEIKIKECIDNQIDIMIDDSYKIYKNLNTNNIQCVLYKNKINSNLIDKGTDSFVSNWIEFYNYIKNI